MPLLSCSFQLTVQEVIENTNLQVFKANKNASIRIATWLVFQLLWRYDLMMFKTSIRTFLSNSRFMRGLKQCLYCSGCSSIRSLIFVIISMETGKIGWNSRISPSTGKDYYKVSTWWWVVPFKEYGNYWTCLVSIYNSRRPYINSYPSRNHGSKIVNGKL